MIAACASARQPATTSSLKVPDTIDSRRIAVDAARSEREPRLFCLGMVDGRVLTVRFTWRDNRIRIIGAGHWHKGRQAYERAES
jgi:uncharacterized DUF497 family protein